MANWVTVYYPPLAATLPERVPKLAAKAEKVGD
jgi:hypothetical protein